MGLSVEQAALGIIRIAVANMSRAIRSVSTEKGHDVREFALFPYGGAGPLHAAAVAAECGIRARAGAGRTGHDVRARDPAVGCQPRSGAQRDHRRPTEQSWPRIMRALRRDAGTMAARGWTSERIAADAAASPA